MTQANDSLDSSGPRPLAAGTVVGGRFRIESLLSREAGTHVYRASDNRGEGMVAVRVIPIGAIGHGPARLLSELDRTTTIRHKNLVDVLSVGREADFLFLASELVDGQTLREFIDGKRAEGRGVSLKGACNLVAHVANGIENAGGMAHGALTPACIWVNRAGRVKVSSLGLGWALPGLARVGAADSTSDLAYAAPEILGGAAPSSQADVHSLGAILYELLTGRSPAAPRAAVSSIITGVPKGVDDVIEAALVRSPERRWSNTRELKEALQAAASGTQDIAAGAAGHSSNGAGATGRATAARPMAAQPVSLGAPGQQPGGGVQPAGGVQPTGAPPPGRASIPPGAGLMSPFAAAPVPGQTAAAGATPLRPAAPPAQVSTSGRQTLGRSFDVGAAAGAAADDSQERWLVQKDKLDFGPFSLVQIRAQIERGDILPEHIIVDSDSGSRCKIKEFPALADFSKAALRRLEQARRAHAEHRSEKAEKKKSMVTTAIVAVVLLVVAGGVAFYVLSRRDATGTKLASREEEAEVESFLKNVKVTGMKASVRRGGGHRAAGAAASGPDEFNNDSNFGDATKGMTQGDQTLDDDQIQSTMMSNYRKLIPCIARSGLSELALEFVVRGTGRVSAVKVNGQKSGSLPGCVLSRMQSFAFPHFNGAKTIASWSMSMRR